MKKIFIICLVNLCILTSCDIEYLATNNNAYINLECFQALNNYYGLYSDCLARDSNYNICYIVSFWNTCNDNDPEMFYDGKNLSGEYVSVGTYTYTTRKGYTKTVQAVMRKKVYYELYKCDKESLKEKLDIVLSYTSIK